MRHTIILAVEILLVAAAAYAVGTSYNFSNNSNDVITNSAQFNFTGKAQVGSSGNLLSSDSLYVNGPVRLADGGTKPTCDASARGMIWHDFGVTNAPDCVSICTKDVSNLYGWRSIYCPGGP